jgi:hypothetical protein
MYKFDLLEIDNDFSITKTKDKSIYNTDSSIPCSEWVRKPISKYKTVDAPQMTSALNYNNSGRGNMVVGSLGYMDNSGNNVRYNGTRVGIYTSCFSNGNGVSILNENFYQVIILFTARKVIKGDWINWYDEYLAPNELHESFEQFKHDSIVYSLFESKSNQSSLRQIEYKDQLWDIKNEFFWMSVDKMKELSDEKGYDELYNDARTSPDRYVHKLLFGEERIYDKLSPDAKEVLDKATELVEKSIELRQVMANDENHLNSWDAGYAQLKLVWKEYFQEDFKEFRQLYKELENRMRPLVYELGFLLK